MMTALSTARPAYGLEGPSAGRTVDNAIPQGSTYRRGNFVQSNGAGSNVDYKKVTELKGVNLNAYRGAGREEGRVTVGK